MMDFDKLIHDIQRKPFTLDSLSRALDRAMKSPERTLTIIKPDAVKQGLIGEVIRRFEAEGCRPVGMKMVRINRLQAQWFYHHLSGTIPKGVFSSLVKYMTSTRVVVIVWQGRGVVRTVRRLCGPTDPAKARSNHIRALSKDDMAKESEHGRAVKNIIHSSATRSDAEKEIGFFFMPWEIMSR